MSAPPARLACNDNMRHVTPCQSCEFEKRITSCDFDRHIVMRSQWDVDVDSTAYILTMWCDAIRDCSTGMLSSSCDFDGHHCGEPGKVESGAKMLIRNVHRKSITKEGLGRLGTYGWVDCRYGWIQSINRINMLSKTTIKPKSNDWGTNTNENVMPLTIRLDYWH